MKFSGEDNHVDWVLMGALTCATSIFMLSCMMLYSITQEKKQFMTECEQDRKHYECQVMWREGNTSTTIIPIITK